MSRYMETGGLGSWRSVLPGLLAANLLLAATQAMSDPVPAAGGSPASSVVRSEVNYQVPDLMMVREDGKKVSFRKELDDGRPVMINFVFATCAAICPALSHVFAKVQGKLGEDAKKIHMVSVSIDPEHDTPEKLREYAAKFKAGPQWNHYTGTLENSVAIQKAFNAYRGDKMNHTPLTIIRVAPGKTWVRLDGFAKPDELIAEVQGRAPAR